jgi:hypothetical protein
VLPGGQSNLRVGIAATFSEYLKHYLLPIRVEVFECNPGATNRLDLFTLPTPSRCLFSHALLCAKLATLINPTRDIERPCLNTKCGACSASSLS